MSKRIFIFARLTLVDETRRDQLLDRLRVLAGSAQRNEPGTLKYASFIPREDDSTTVYAIEEYADQAAFDEHMSLPSVKSAEQWLAEEKVLEPGTKPEMFVLEYLPDSRHIRPEVQDLGDPHVLFAELDYVPGGVDTSLPYWDEVAKTSRDETGTLMYGILRDPKQENRLFAAEAYESPEYLKDVHVPSKAIQESIANTKHLRTGLKHHVLRKKDGYLYKD